MMMQRGKVIGTAALSLLLALGTASTAMAASGAVVTPNSVEPGRTVNQTGVGTGVLTANATAPVLYNVDKSVVLSGKVTIDGPVLKMQLVNYPSVVFNITKVADGLFIYSATLPLGTGDKGDLDLTVNAYTVYQNGKTAGQVHSTVAGPVSAGNVHVAYVKRFEVGPYQFGQYNRKDNTFVLSYTLNKVWDDEKLIDHLNQTATVKGTDEYAVKASDPSYINGPAEVGVETLTPPVVLKETAITDISYTYDRVTNTFSCVYQETDTNSKLQQTVTSKSTSLPGTETKAIQATYGDGTTETVYTIVPPVMPRSLTVVGAPTYSYDPVSGTYTAVYEVEELFSNNSKKTTVNTVSGLKPNTTSADVVKLDDLSVSVTYNVPAAPVTAPVVTNVAAVVQSSTWTGNNANGGNVQEDYTLNFVINGQVKSVVLSTNFTKTGTGFVTQHLTYVYTYNNQPVTITYDLPFVQPATGDNTNVKNN